MIQRADQVEAVTAVRIYLQGEDGICTGHGSEQVTHYRVAQSSAIGSQPLGFQGSNVQRIIAQTELTGTVGTEINQCIEAANAAAGRCTLAITVSDAAWQLILIHLTGNQRDRLLRLVVLQRHGNRNVVFDLDYETAGIQATERVIVAIGRGNQRREVDGRAKLLVITRRAAISHRMIQWAKQRKGVTTIRVYLQGEDGFCASRGGEQIAYHGETQRHTTRGQSLGFHGCDTSRAVGQANGARAIGTEVDRRIKGTSTSIGNGINAVTITDTCR